MLVLVFLLSLGIEGIFSENGSPRDSYLDAYRESHGISKTDREYEEPLPYPPTGYQYGPPKFTYGPPSGPMQSYGPPVPVYGPPTPVYGAPHAMLGLLDKLKFKLDLFTIGKILLKIVLFKKLVSFIAIICLLIFIPTLKKKVDDAYPENGDDGDDGDDGDMRSLGPKKYKAGDEFLTNISSFVLGAIEDFSTNHTLNTECDNVYCKTKKIAKRIDERVSYKKLAKMYEKEMM